MARGHHPDGEYFCSASGRPSQNSTDLELLPEWALLADRCVTRYGRERSHGGVRQRLPREHGEDADELFLDYQRVTGKRDHSLALCPFRIGEPRIFEHCIRQVGLPLFGNEADLEFPHGDPSVRLRQVLINLVGNAIKFTEAGSVRVAVRCEGARGPRPQLVFDVVDTGLGLSPEQLAKLFTPFTQADSSTTRRFGGTGLGLTICKRLAAMLGGELAVTSAPGRGSTFSLSVSAGPLEGVRMTEVTIGAKAESLPIPAPGKPVVLAGVSVLLAEDGIDNQRLIATFLRKAGASVMVVENGHRAVEEATVASEELRPFHVILMDMQMPELDGYGATSALRMKGYEKPIIALTAHAMSGDRERCIGAGCNDYLPKPVARDALLALVAQYAAPLREETAPAEPLISTLGDPDMGEIVGEFVRHLPDRILALGKAIEGSDSDTARRLAHQLKGAAGSYGFPSITQVAAAVERAITAGGPPQSIQDEFNMLTDLCNRARAPTAA
jgi:CheY-like chemotaxis protein